MADVVIPGSLVVALIAVWGVVAGIVTTLFLRLTKSYEDRLVDARRDTAKSEVEREWLLGLVVRATDQTGQALSLAEVKAKANTRSGPP